MRELAQSWISAFERALTARDRYALSALFAEDSHWRDNGALTWDFRQYSGRDKVIDHLVSAAGHTRPRRWRISERWPAPALRDAAETPLIEAFFDFETERALAVGLLHAHVDPSSATGIRAHALYTRIEELKGVGASEIQPHEPRFEDGESEVLVIGAGQAGLMLTAHLRQLGVDVVVAEGSHVRFWGGGGQGPLMWTNNGKKRGHLTARVFVQFTSSMTIVDYQSNSCKEEYNH